MTDKLANRPKACQSKGLSRHPMQKICMLNRSVKHYRAKRPMPVNIIKDITVIECSTFVTGPYAAALLGDLGARVIKIESPPEGDPYRYFAPDPYFSFNFAHLNRNKQSLVLDLKSPEGQKICFELLKQADVF